MADVKLVRAVPEDAERIHRMKYRAFLPLYERYRDDETSPVKEPVDKVIRQLNSRNTDYYLIECDGDAVGAVRAAFDGAEDGRLVYRVSPLFILPEHQGCGIGFAAMTALLRRYPQAGVWRLSTILQERRNCRLYERCGFVRCGTATPVNDRMTIVYYQKLQGLCYRRASEDDAQTLIGIYDAAFREDFLRYGECPGYGHTIASMRDSIARIPKQLILLDDRPVGAISWVSRGAGEYEIRCLCVLPEHQRRGIGAQALRYMRECCPDWRRILLITPADSMRTLCFYEKCGFRAVGTEMDGGVQVARLVLERGGERTVCSAALQ